MTVNIFGIEMLAHQGESEQSVASCNGFVHIAPGGINGGGSGAKWREINW